LKFYFQTWEGSAPGLYVGFVSCQKSSLFLLEFSKQTGIPVLLIERVAEAENTEWKNSAFWHLKSVESKTTDSRNNLLLEYENFFEHKMVLHDHLRLGMIFYDRVEA
jgi:hypothetical protein